MTSCDVDHRVGRSFPTRRSSDLDRRGGGARLRAGTGAGPDAPVGVTADLRGELDVLLDLPVHPAAGAAAALVQPGLPVRAGERGDPLHRDRPDRHPHQRSDDPDAGRDPGAGPAPGGLRRRADPRRHPLGRPGPARGGRGAGHPRPGPLPADRPAAGDAGDPAHRLQRDHRPGQGHLDRVRAGPCRAVLHRPADLWAHPAGAADAAGRDRLVRGDHLAPVHRAVLHRAPLRQGRGTHSPAHPAATTARRPHPPPARPERSLGMSLTDHTHPAHPHPEHTHPAHPHPDQPRSPDSDPGSWPSGSEPDRERILTAPAGGLVTIRDVRKSFGDLEVLRGIDLTVRPGEVTAILGPSGSGKSTLLRTINHLETIDAGLITLDGEVIGYVREGNLLHELPEREVLRQRTQVGMVFQGFNLFAHMTALQNVAEAPRRALGVPKRVAEARARELLALVGLAEKAGEHPRRLSGGQQQRVAIARALALDPKVLLFDEPTSALEPELVEAVLAVIRRLARQGTTLMIVTHEISFARSVADTVVFMDRGAIVAQGPPSAVIDHPAHDRTRSFLQRVRTGEEEPSPRQDAPAPAHREDTTSPSHAASIPTSVPRPAEEQS